MSLTLPTLRENIFLLYHNHSSSCLRQLDLSLQELETSLKIDWEELFDLNLNNYVKDLRELYETALNEELSKLKRVLRIHIRDLKNQFTFIKEKIVGKIFFCLFCKNARLS